jgi:hypothetical protein
VTEPNSERAELLTPPHNFAVVQLPGRGFPGVVFQGDSLAGLCEQAAALAEDIDGAAELSGSLNAILRGYLRVLNERGIEPPFAYRPPSA